MKQKHKYIGLDVHKDQNQVAIAADGGCTGSISKDLHALEKLVYKLRGPNIDLHFVYEAGPCGFVIARRLAQLSIDCIVVSPPLVPKKGGDRIKTNRRDAVMLARLLRAGELKPIRVPDAADEAIRDLCRARTDAVKEMRAAPVSVEAVFVALRVQVLGQEQLDAGAHAILTRVGVGRSGSQSGARRVSDGDHAGSR